MKGKNIVILSDDYQAFIKDQVECLSDKFDHIFVFVRYNPLAILGSILPFKSIQHYQKKNRVDLTNIPENIHLYYIPLIHRNFHNLHFRLIDHLIQKHNIKFDLIHAHFIYPGGFVGVKLKNKYGVPLIITAHGYDIYDLPFRNMIWKKNIVSTLNNADEIITVSYKNLEYIRLLDIKKPASIIPNGYRDDLFFPIDRIKSREILNLPINKKIILTIGNLVTIKGQIYLIKAIEGIIKDRSDLICIIVGRGNLEKILQNKINELNLNNDIFLVGKRPHHEINLWINACDIFVLPSLNEGNPTVMFECLGCGKPFIGTNVGGIPEVITSNKYGILVEPGDSYAIEKALKAALDIKWEDKEILTYASQYSYNEIIKKIFQLYMKHIRTIE